MMVVVAKSEIDKCPVDFYSGKRDISKIMKKFNFDLSREIFVENSFAKDCFIFHQDL